MTHTTPEHARKIARELDDHNSSLDRAARIALRSLATQIEAMTTERDALAVKLKRIADLDPEKDSDAGFNEWGEAHCFELAQAIAKDKS